MLSFCCVEVHRRYSLHTEPAAYDISHVCNSCRLLQKPHRLRGRAQAQASFCLQDAESYKATAAHVELAKKMMKRDSATAPTVGERVAFVIVKGAKGAKAHEKAEDPIFALENNLPIDAQHYLDHHLTQPLMRIFEPILGEKRAKSLLSGAHAWWSVTCTPAANEPA